MRHFPASLSFLFAVFVALTCAPLFVFAVPNDNPFPNGGHRVPSKHHSYRLRSVFPQLTWIRDTAIEKVFGVPPKTTQPSRERLSSLSYPTSSQLPATLLAKYGGDVVLRFNVSTSEEETALSEAADTLFLDVWEFTDDWADIRLREDDVPSLLGLLPKSLHKAYSPLMPDLARTIYMSYPSIAFAEPAFPDSHTEHVFTPDLRTSDGGVDNIFFRDYQPLSVIVPWMRLMASMFTTHVRMINIGVSYEGRDIPALRVGVHPTNFQAPSKPRRTIIVLGGSHAREWISVSSVTYIAWSMITSYGKSTGITKLIQEFDWVFIPTLNVDGYVFTWENDRLWRKNRQQTNLRFCRGLDLDRGFGFEWDGTSFQSNPCSESYPGNEPFQAVESHRFAEWAKNETEQNNVSFVGFLDLHSYSQQVLYPYSYSCSSDPPSLENLEELATGLAKAIRISSGEYYSVSSACEGAVSFSKKSKLGRGSMGASSRMETGGGSAMDWFYHEMQVRYSYQIKLRDTGIYGFLLPSDQIVPTGEEVLNAIKYFGDFLLGNKGIESSLSSTLHQSLEKMGRYAANDIPAALDDSPAGVEANEEDDEMMYELRMRR